MTMSAETAVRQATYTVDIYMDVALRRLRELFGDDYVVANPEIAIRFATAYAQACATDLQAMWLAQAVGGVLSQVASSLDSIDNTLLYPDLVELERT